MPDWLYKIGQQALEAVNQSGPPVLAALFILTFLTEFAIPFPWVQDVIYYYVGFQLGRSTIREIPVLLAMLSGRMAGSSVLYWLARAVGPPFINWVGRRFRSFPQRIGSFKEKLVRHTALALASARLIPGGLVPSTFAAGAVRLSYPGFLLGVLEASLVDDGTTILSGLVTRLSIEYLGITPSPLVFGIGVVLTEIGIWLVPWLYFRVKSGKKNERPAATPERDGCEKK